MALVDDVNGAPRSIFGALVQRARGARPAARLAAPVLPEEHPRLVGLDPDHLGPDRVAPRHEMCVDEDVQELLAAPALARIETLSWREGAFDRQQVRYVGR